MKRPQAPEIFQKPIAAIDMTGLPPRGSPNFDQAVTAWYALGYASRGWNAVVTVDNEFVRVVAIPENSIDPKKYVLGLLQQGFLEDALPIRETPYGMSREPGLSLERRGGELPLTQGGAEVLEECAPIARAIDRARSSHYDAGRHARGSAAKRRPPVPAHGEGDLGRHCCGARLRPGREKASADRRH